MSGRAESRPKYREAYPRFDVLRATTAYRRGQDLCVYRDEQGRVLGTLRFSIEEGGWVAVVRGELGGPNIPSWRGVERLRLLSAANDVRGVRRVMTCPDCSGRVQVLFRVANWACATCHGLHYRRQLVDRQTRDAEALLAAELRLKEPRPKGKHQKTFAAARAKDLALIQRLQPVVQDGWRRVASAAHQPRVEATWMTPESARFNSELALWPRFNDDWDGA